VCKYNTINHFQNLGVVRDEDAYDKAEESRDRGKYLDDEKFEETQPLLATVVLSIIVG
jgi:hypothetical protein